LTGADDVATQEQKLDSSLARLQGLAKGGRVVFAAREMGRVHRDRLIAAGHLQRIIGGWLLRTRPGRDESDGTAWWAAYWTFCGAYCESRFESRWHLSAEQSLLLHVGDTVVPASLVVCASRGQNNHLELLHGTMLYDLREANQPPAEDLVVRDGLRLYTLDAALVKVPEAFYVAHPLEAQLALRAVPDASGLLRRLLRTGQPIVAGRLAGAFRHIGRIDLTEEIIATMRSAGHAPIERNPFTAPRLPIAARRGAASIVARLAGLYTLGRASIADRLPVSPGRMADPNAALLALTALHVEDAFHGLWLDGQLVTREALERVSRGEVSLAQLVESRDEAGLTALGDYQAFLAVQRSLGALFGGAPVIEVLREAHREWYRELMQPKVAARLQPVSVLAGYRDDAVYLASSRFVPPDAQSMRAALPALFDLLEGESHPFARAIMARWLFSYLHPYRLGNERMAHFLMNVLLLAAGWSWRTLVGPDQERYRDAMEQANLSFDLGPLVALLREGLVPAGTAVNAAVASAPVSMIESPTEEAHHVEVGVPTERAANPVEPAAGPVPVMAVPESELLTPQTESADVSIPVEGMDARSELAVETASEVAADLSGVPAVVPVAAAAPAVPQPPAPAAKSTKGRRKYAPQPTQMGLFGE
jgi:hypothetical protein